MIWEDLSAEIYDLLYQLGLTANYTGFFHIAYAVYLVLGTPQRLCLVTKWLYPDVAGHYRTSSAAVERNIRTAVARIWTDAPARLIQISCVPLTSRPTNARFLGILAAHLSRSHSPRVS